VSDPKDNLILLPGVAHFVEQNAPGGLEPAEEERPEIVPPNAELLIPVLEAVLFAADRPLSVDELQEVLGLRSPEQIRAGLQVLRDSGISRGAGIRIDEVAGGYQLRTHPKATAWVSRLQEVKPVRLSNAAVETLAIIAYRQPVTRHNLEDLRGVDCGGMVRNLVHRGLVKTMGRSDVVGRPLLYGTTREFLEFFGLRDLSDLPALRDLREMQADDPEEGPQATLF
jgi:segregation and condensation protein B